jgi:hypothetical protein
LESNKERCKEFNEKLPDLIEKKIKERKKVIDEEMDILSKLDIS